MHLTVLPSLMVIAFVSLANCLTINRIDSTTPKVTTQRTTTLMPTTVSPNNPVKNPVASGPIVVLQHHGTLNGPSGRFEKTEFAAFPPVDLSLPPVVLPEFTPINEEPEGLHAAASDVVPHFERTENLSAPPADLDRPPAFLPEATPIKEPLQEDNKAREALYFVRG